MHVYIRYNFVMSNEIITEEDEWLLIDSQSSV